MTRYATAQANLLALGVRVDATIGTLRLLADGAARDADDEDMDDRDHRCQWDFAHGVLAQAVADLETALTVCCPSTLTPPPTT